MKKNAASKKEMNEIIRKAGTVNRFYSRWTEVDKKDGCFAVFADSNNDIYLSVKNTANGIWCNVKTATYTASRYCTETEAISFLNTAMLHA
jgi:hypothetical protein